MRLIFLGPPGSGKGTQAELLADKLDIPHISTGDIFRDNIKKETDLGKKAKEYIDKGQLVPDHVTNYMVKGRLEKLDGYILDGYPRTIPQAKFLDCIQDIDKVVEFELSDKEVIKRISGRRTCKKCGAMYHIVWNPPKKKGVCDECGSALIQRSDDKPETIKKRLEVYKKQTAPLIDYYSDKLIKIDASPSIEKIHAVVMRRLC